MKIGIITFHSAINYGAVLQAFALQEKLKLIGHDVSIIDYRCEAIELDHSPSLFLYEKNFKRKLKLLLRYPIRKRKRKIFDKFIYSNLDLSSDRNITKDLIGNSLLGKYDVIICGSDQIWNFSLTGNDTTYLLDFVETPTKKISYAASFGVSDIPEKEREIFKKLLSTFNKISVREIQGKQIINKFLDKDVTTVIDPTFLLTKEQWQKFTVYTKNSNYVLLYLLRPNNDLVKIANNIADKNNCKVITISDSLVRKPGITYLSKVSPLEWVALFNNATTVVTNSFHGTAFSLNFNKPVLIGLSSAKNNGNSRITDLLTTLGIDYKIENNLVDLTNDIDAQLINNNINKERNRAISFLDLTEERGN